MILANIRGRGLPMLAAVLLLAIACVAIAPNYVTGQWAWSYPVQLSATKSLRSLRQEGLGLAGWVVLDQQTVDIGNKKWSVQALAPTLDRETLPYVEMTLEQAKEFQTDPVLLFLRPQSDAKDEPLVEWIDIDSFRDWTVDQQRTVHLSVANSGTHSTSKKVSVSAHYFRGWKRVQSEDGLNRNTYTYAVMQWYAWPSGGSPKIAEWFWADQWRQWRDRQRMPWAAVTMLIPIEPLGDIASVQPLGEAIAQSIQTTLTAQIFST